MKKKKSELRNIRFSRLYLLIGLFVFGIIFYRMYQLATSKTIDGVDLQSFASKRSTKLETLYSKRGTIFDATGDILAENVSSYTLTATLTNKWTKDESKPQYVVDKEKTAEELSVVLGEDKEKLLSYLNKDADVVYLGPKSRDLTELKKDEILALNLPGINFVETQKRYYPYGDFASYVLGYARKKEVENEEGKINEEIIGEMGIEAYYNDDLTGTNGSSEYQKDRKGYKIPGTKEITIEAIDGNDIYLTINSSVQLFVEDAMEKLDNACHPSFISVMLADAKTGAILASGTTPSFDPNIKNISSYLNLNTSMPYEPGSTMKIYSYMAAMENDAYNGDETYKSGIFVAKDGTEIGDWKREGWGILTYDQGFALSSNVAVMNMIDRHLSADQLKAYYNKLGFGSKTGIELPNESSGKIAFRYQTEILNAGFGQGITTTPIQNIKALTSISNNGILLQPYIIDKIVNHDTGEIIYKGEKKEIERVASLKTVDKIKELMRSVVTGTSATSTGYYYNMPGYDFIAKTGTAQVVNDNGIGYSNSFVIRGLAGMFPGDDPQVIIYMAVKSEWCSTRDIGEMVRSIIKNTSKYLEIYDETKATTTKLEEIEVDSYLNKYVESVNSILQSNQINTVILGNGEKVVAQYPIQGNSINKIDKVFLLTNGNEIRMPDLTGYSTRDLMSFISLVKIPYTAEGIGYVVSQNIPPGTLIDENSNLEVKLESKY